MAWARLQFRHLTNSFVRAPSSIAQLCGNNTRRHRQDGNNPGMVSEAIALPNAV